MKKPGKISASMMCSRLVDLEETIKIFESKKIDMLHIDVMDGQFVPNFGLGVDYIKGLRELTRIPLDIHLMVKDPEFKYGCIGIQPTDTVSVHYESTYQVQRAFDILKPYGCKCYLAINPATPVCMLEELLTFIDGVTLLMVNPGFAGQAMVESTMKKAQKLQRFLAENGKADMSVEVDGNITPERAATLRGYGADIFVAGTSSIFRGDIKKLGANIDVLRRAITDNL